MHIQTARMIPPALLSLRCNDSGHMERRCTFILCVMLDVQNRVTLCLFSWCLSCMAAFCVQERGTNEYRVVTVGHSLAAGVAALVAVLLRHEYPTIHCYAYSPPGCLVRFVWLSSCIAEDSCSS